MNNVLFLASKSPRRLALLQELGYEPVVIASNNHTLRAFAGDETPLGGELPQAYVVRTSQTKFAQGLALRAERYPQASETPVLAADTVVSIDNIILGKPEDEAQARDFLMRLSGRTHLVRTAVTAGTGKENVRTVLQVSKVTFKRLNTHEIERYIASQEPYDKAGGYGIQGKGGLFISRLSGSYTGVMGLPMFETSELLARFNCLPALLA